MERLLTLQFRGIPTPVRSSSCLCGRCCNQNIIEIASVAKRTVVNVGNNFFRLKTVHLGQKTVSPAGIWCGSTSLLPKTGVKPTVVPKHITRSLYFGPEWYTAVGGAISAMPVTRRVGAKARPTIRAGVSPTQPRRPCDTKNKT